MQKSIVGFWPLVILFAGLISLESHAMKWQGRRQSKNIIDIRKETQAVNVQMGLEAGRRHLVAMMMTAEKDAYERQDCVTLNQEVERLKTVRVELEAMGTEPVRRLVCAEEAPASRVNLCSKLMEGEQTIPTPDLKKFREELQDTYGPALVQVAQIQDALAVKAAFLTKEDIKCRAALQLIRRKAAQVQSSYSELLQLLEKLEK